MTHDRTGEPVDDTTQTTTTHDSRCRSGWLGETDDGNPIPCLTCRPHLRRSAR